MPPCITCLVYLIQTHHLKTKIPYLIVVTLFTDVVDVMDHTCTVRRIITRITATITGTCAIACNIVSRTVATSMGNAKAKDRPRALMCKVYQLTVAGPDHVDKEQTTNTTNYQPLETVENPRGSPSQTPKAAERATETASRPACQDLARAMQQ